jgi:hypothetical protein
LISRAFLGKIGVSHFHSNNFLCDVINALHLNDEQTSSDLIDCVYHWIPTEDDIQFYTAVLEGDTIFDTPAQRAWTQEAWYNAIEFKLTGSYEPFNASPPMRHKFAVCGRRALYCVDEVYKQKLT